MGHRSMLEIVGHELGGTWWVGAKSVVMIRPQVASEVPFRTNSGIQPAVVGRNERNGQSRPWHCAFEGGGITRS
jgi:hypothetical protein